MTRHQKQFAGMEHAEDDTADDAVTVKALLHEVLKELRQIRGILGHMAATSPPPRDDGEQK